MEALESHEELRALPIEEIAKKGDDAANKLTKFEENIANWTLPIDVALNREEVTHLMADFDDAVTNIKQYSESVDKVVARYKLKAKAEDDVVKRHMKSLKDRLYQVMVKTTPRILAKAMYHMR